MVPPACHSHISGGVYLQKQLSVPHSDLMGQTDKHTDRQTDSSGVGIKIISCHAIKSRITQLFRCEYAGGYNGELGQSSSWLSSATQVEGHVRQVTLARPPCLTQLQQMMCINARNKSPSCLMLCAAAPALSNEPGCSVYMHLSQTLPASRPYQSMLLDAC